LCIELFVDGGSAQIQVACLRCNPFGPGAALSAEGLTAGIVRGYSLLKQ
jgi:hypothetical protein